MSDVKKALDGLQQIAWAAEEVDDAFTYERAIDAKETIRALTAEVAALRKDAERYRWLRHKLTCGHLTNDEQLSIIGAKSPEVLDAVIDAAVEAANATR